jgi:hypothetical protein
MTLFSMDENSYSFFVQMKGRQIRSLETFKQKVKD